MDDFVSWDDEDIPWDQILEMDIDLVREYGDGTDFPNSQDEAIVETENIDPQVFHNRRSEKRQKNTSKPKYVCSVCSRTYKTVGGFKQHVAKKHNKQSVQIQEIGGEQSTEVTHEKQSDFTITVRQAQGIAFKNVAESKFRTSKSSIHGYAIVEIAEDIVNQPPEILHIFNEMVNFEFCKVFKLSNYSEFCSTSCRERVFTAYNQMISDQVLMKKMQEEVAKIVQGSTYSNNIFCKFVACYLREQLQVSLHLVVQSLKNSSEVKSVEIPDRDQGILFYIAGYILRKLKKLSAKTKQRPAIQAAISSLFKGNKRGVFSFIQKYAEWTKKINHGGLTIPSDDLFLLVRECELLCRKHSDSDKLTARSLIKTKLKEIFLESFMINHYWDKLLCDQGFVRMFLLEKIFDVFLTVRGFALTRYVRTKGQLATKGQKSLRQTLKLSVY